MTSLIGSSSCCGTAPKLTGAIITGLPITFHCTRLLDSDFLSQSICCAPVIVRFGSLTSASAAGTGVGAAVLTCSLR